MTKPSPALSSGVVWGERKPVGHRLRARFELIRTRTARRSGQSNPPRLFVLGNQKSGTTVVADACARLLDETCQQDFPLERFHPTYHLISPRSRFYIDTVIERNLRCFTRGVVKEPGLTAHFQPLRVRYPTASFLFVVRDPIENIRSVLDRLGLVGPDGIVPQPVAYPWLSICFNLDLGEEMPSHLDLDEMVARMARRWTYLVSIARRACEAGQAQLVRYEDFVRQPGPVLQQALEASGLIDVPVGVEDLLGRQHQHRGAHRGRGGTILARWTEQISVETRTEAARLGYRL